MSNVRRCHVREALLPNGRALTVRVWPGRGVPLVLLHGFMDDSQGWEDLAAATHRPCYAFDLAGFGASRAHAAHRRLDDYAADVHEACQYLGVETFVLVGHSMGGGVATALAERAPATVKALILLAPAGFARLHAAEAANVPGVDLALRAGMPLALANPLLGAGVYATMVAGGRLPDRRMLARMRSGARNAGAGIGPAGRALAHAGRSARAFFKRPVRYEGPVFALWGREDRLIPRSHIRGLKVAFPHARISVWAGMAHHPQAEQPELLARYVERACCTARRTRRVRTARTAAAGAERFAA